MKKTLFIALVALICNFASAQLEQVSYQGAFAPAPAAMWTDNWTNWDPKNTEYADALPSTAGVSNVVNVSTDITYNTTWYTGKTYKITGLIYVRNNATLTIQPGVVVKGVYSSSGTALVITKGSKLNAIGTVTSPIVFTSAKTVAEGRAPADWGGIVLLGKAGFNLNGGVNNIEGITASVNTEYGGGTTPDDNDNSGVLKYVRIEFGGFVFSPNNEINGLTFGAVGRGTTIDYVQVSYSGDDSFEWFGGSVNNKHLVAYRGLDDDFDTDNGYKGISQFCLGIRDPQIADNPAISTSEGFESDNNATGLVTPGTDNTTCIFSNCTLFGPSYRATLAPALTVAVGHERAARLRRSSQQKIFNSIFLDFKNNFLFVDGSVCVANANNGSLKFKNNILAGYINASYPSGVNPTSLNSWMTASNNSVMASSASVLTKAYGISSSDYTTGNLDSGYNLDYRPLSATGADFSDSSLTNYVVVTPLGSTPVVRNIVYCKGDLTAQVTARLTSTGTLLKWYASATTTTVLATAPTPSTAAAATFTYYVAQVDGATGAISERVALSVTVSALPTEVVGTITGVGPTPDGASVADSAFAVGKYVGTTTAFTYSVPAFVDASLSYFWSVPLGVNILSGQGTNTITVNYFNVPPGAGYVGTINIQAVNEGGCKTPVKAITISKALPTAPSTLVLYNKNAGYPTPTTAFTNFAPYIGTTTALTLTAGVSVTASSYSWSLPTGVGVALGAAVAVTSVTYFTALPLVTPYLTEPVPAIGTKYWKVTYKKYTVDVNGVSTVVSVSTCDQKIYSKSPYGATTSQVYAPYGTVITSDKPSILVSLSGIDSTTTALYVGVKAANGVGLSTTSNIANSDASATPRILGLYDATYSEAYTAPIPPSTPATSVISILGEVLKTSKLLKLIAIAPTAPTTLVLNDSNSLTPTTSLTVVSKFIGTSKVLTLKAGFIAAAASYTWELPEGVTQLSGTTTNVITVDLAGVPTGTAALYFGVKASNFMGSSVTNNSALVPATTSTAKLLKVTAGLPAAVSTVSGQIGLVCSNATVDYIMTASLLANTYAITAPAGTIVTSTMYPDNTTNTLETSELTFSVKYPTPFTVTTATLAANKTITIYSKNGFGRSAVAKTLTLTSGNCTASGRMEEMTASISELYPNPSTTMLNIDITSANESDFSMVIYSLNGAVVISKVVGISEGFTTVSENVSNLSNGLYFVKLVNNTTNETFVKKFVKN